MTEQLKQFLLNNKNSLEEDDFRTLYKNWSKYIDSDDVSDLNFCAANGVKLALQIIGYAIFVVKIVIPIVLIVYGTMDIAKAVIDAKDGLQKNLIRIQK